MKELITNAYPKSSITEAIKTIKTNLRFSSVNKKIKTILITSPVAEEGKSFISSNLAATFATETEKVLLIDCDLRRGRQHNIFELTKENILGLSNLLIDEEWDKNLKKYINKTEVANLDVLLSGATPPNSSALLESQKIEELVDKLKKKYDVIIFDAPPVIGLTDALILTRLADVVLIVARARKTTMEMLENTKIALEKVNANIAGVILNRISAKDNKYFKNYYEQI